MQQERVTPFGWIAFAVSVAAATCIYLTAWSAVYTDGQGPWPTSGYGIWLGPVVFFAAVGGTLLAIVLDVIAGEMGRRSRRLGVIGGLALLLPIALIYLDWPVAM